MTSNGNSGKSPDLCIMGAGVVGLWTAWKALDAGMSVRVFDRTRIGKGASGGVLGALMPHRPSQWTASKQFQLDALITLGPEIVALEEVAGISCGYRRCGRLMPIDTDKRLDEHRSWQQAAGENWAGTDARWNILDKLPGAWPMSQALAYDFDTLSARVNPRALLAALAAGVRARGGEIAEGEAVAGPDDLVAGKVVIAAGHDSFALAGTPQAGWGVKGQAVLLEPVSPLPDDLPILYRGGTYVVRHDDGRVAVGSTSQRDFADDLPESGTTARLLADGISLCPALAGATLVESWAGIRPRAAARQPMVGPMPGNARVIMATGGFKITLGIAHTMADAAVAFARDENPELPPGFTPAEQLASV
jgi:glycine oxidase